MDLLEYTAFGQEVAKLAAVIPREFGGGASRSGRRPIRASKLLDKSKPRVGFPPSKIEEDDKTDDRQVIESMRSEMTPASSVGGFGL